MIAVGLSNYLSTGPGLGLCDKEGAVLLFLLLLEFPVGEHSLLQPLDLKQEAIPLTLPRLLTPAQVALGLVDLLFQVTCVLLQPCAFLGHLSDPRICQRVHGQPAIRPLAQGDVASLACTNDK